MKVSRKAFLLAALGAASFSLGVAALAASSASDSQETAPPPVRQQLAQAPQPAPPKPAEAPKPTETAKPANLDRNSTLILIRTTLTALDQANKTGNYTVLRDLGAPGFQAGNTAARLSEIFASQRRDRLDLSGAVYLDPQITLAPQIEPNGLLHMAGFYPSVPNQIKFELLFAPVQGVWKLFGLSVVLEKTGAAAPAEAPKPPGAR